MLALSGVARNLYGGTMQEITKHFTIIKKQHKIEADWGWPRTPAPTLPPPLPMPLLSSILHVLDLDGVKRCRLVRFKRNTTDLNLNVHV